MRKILFLVCILLAGASGASAAVTASFVQGSQVTSAAGIVDGNKYVIRVKGASYITENGAQYAAPETQNSITANAIFTFIQDGESWKVKNETTGNYWGTLTGSATGTFAPATEESAGSWTFTFSGNNIVLTSGSYYVNRSSGVMHGWSSTIALQIYQVEEVNLVTGIDDIVNNKAYYVTTYDRGAWFVADGGSAMTSTTKAGYAASMSDTKQQFAFLTYGTTGVYHLYSVSEKKFVSKSGDYTTLTSELGDNVKLLATTNVNYPFVVALNDGSNQMGISNGYDPAVITFWNSLTDGGNQVQIREVADFDPTEAMAILEAAYSTTVTVTYEVYDGTTLVESLNAVQDKNSAVSIPTALLKNTWYYDYAASGTIGETDCTITVNRTYKTSVVTSLSGLSNNKAYTLVTERGSFTTVDGVLDNTSKSGSSYTVYNFAIVNYEDVYYLWSVQDGKFVAGNGTSLTETPTAITINALDEPLFKIQCGSNYLNCNTNAGGFFSTWSTTDGGNKVAFIEAADFDPSSVIAALTNFAPSVIANIKPYFDGAGDGLFQLKASVAEANNTTYTAALTMCNSETYNELLAIVSNVDNFNLPEAGKFYLVKNNYNGKYMRLTAIETRGTVFADLTEEEANIDISAHFTFEESDSKLYMTSQKGYLNWVYGSGYEGYARYIKDKYVHFAAPAPGVGSFSIAYGDGVDSYATYLGGGFYALKGTGTTVVAGSSSDQTSELAQWTFEEVSNVDITLHDGGDGKYYASLYAPFGLTLPSGTEAFVGELGEGTISLTSIGQDVPAATAVVLVGNAATITVAINDDIDAFTGTNDLEGQYLGDADATDTKLSLGKVDGVVGFYKYDSALGANKAYITTSTSSNGFKFVFADDDLTGIVNAQSSMLNGQSYYDLYGRKIAAPQKGQIYIVNGKVVKM